MPFPPILKSQETSAVLFSKESHGYVYKWTEISTGKWYIGSRSAKNSHINDGYICSSKIVKPLIQNHPENWVREILWIGERQYATTVESIYLIECNAANNVTSYNLHNLDGKFFCSGKVTSEETKQKIRKSKLGISRSEETKHLLRIANLGKKHTAQSRQKMKESKQFISQETRDKQSNARKGKQFTEEHKQKIREASLNHRHTEETKNKLSILAKSRISPRIGTSHSDESKEKLSEAAKNRKKIECKYCKKYTDISTYNRWHNENCKHK